MKMKKHLILSMLLLGFAGMLEAENVQRTLPDVVEGVRDEVISLNGEWQFQYAPEEKWERVTVPGELAMQGYGIEHDKPVLYKKTVLVPADYRGKQVILRFDGVYSYARLWVNGKQVKLRGACRHDIHPTLGRTSTPELDSLDAALFKRANMNFVRTSHYPPTESFLKYCDREGIYVECETAVCFVDTYRQKNYAPGKSQDDPEATAQYLGQLEEMVATSRSHASVLFWSIGNESVYGKNFQLSYDWLKNEDKTRPVIFSYPGLVEYPGILGNLSG